MLIIHQSTYILAWKKLDGEMDAVRAYDDGMGTLTIENVQQGDAGTYECFGSNFISEGRSNAYLIVVSKYYLTPGLTSSVKDALMPTSLLSVSII